MFDRHVHSLMNLHFYSSCLEQLQHVEKELHDKAQQQLKINEEYRQQVTDYINSNPLMPLTSNTNSGKKKRTTSSSSTSSSSSTTSTLSIVPSTVNIKHDESSSLLTNNINLPIPSATINFFSISNNDNDSSSTINVRSMNKGHLATLHSHHHHPKMKKSSHRQLSKFDRRLEQHLHENQTHIDDMNTHFKDLQLLSLNDVSTNSMKMPMRINTDTQKALEHLRELASNPSALERIQTLANNPNLIQEIKKIANQSFNEQLRTLPPFIPAHISSSTAGCIESKSMDSSKNSFI
jgi:hypothetical protein